MTIYNGISASSYTIILHNYIMSYIGGMMDSYRHRGLRRQLIKQLVAKGITDESVLEAIGTVPRHLFLDTAFEEQAYMDKALPISSHQTISQPFTVAIQTQLLDVGKKDKVLEIGTGSGYQAAVLTHLCHRIYSIERHESLYLETTAKLKQCGYESVRTLHGDGYAGAPRFAPFDRIIVTAGADEVPQALLDQLVIGGIMVIPAGNEEVKQMYKITKVDESNYEKEIHGKFRFVPFVKGKN